MGEIIVAIIFILFTVCLLTDTELLMYDRVQTSYSSLYYRTDHIKTYPLKLPIYGWVIIGIVYSIPIVNIIGFISFITFYIVKISMKPECYEATPFHIFRLKGNNIVTKSLIAIIKFLNKKV